MLSTLPEISVRTLRRHFFKIIMPLSIPGIISGITMVFVPSLTTFVISDLLGGSKILLIGNVIEQEFKQGSNWNVGSGLSLVLMLFIIASMALIAKYDKNGREIHFDQINRKKNLPFPDLCIVIRSHYHFDGSFF